MDRKSKGILKLDYYANYHSHDYENVFSVSRTRPEGFDGLKDLDMLAPGSLLLRYFKNGSITWEEFRRRYVNGILNSEEALSQIDSIGDLLDKRETVTLLCWEKYMPCHRFILGQLFHDLGYSVVYKYGKELYTYENGECYYEKGNLSLDFQSE